MKYFILLIALTLFSCKSKAQELYEFAYENNATIFVMLQVDLMPEYEDTGYKVGYGTSGHGKTIMRRVGTSFRKLGGFDIFLTGDNKKTKLISINPDDYKDFEKIPAISDFPKQLNWFYQVAEAGQKMELCVPKNKKFDETTTDLEEKFYIEMRDKTLAQIEERKRKGYK